LNEAIDQRIISDNDNYDQNITLADVNRGEKLIDNDDEINIKAVSPVIDN